MNASSDTRRRDLRRMQILATLLLGLMFAIFATTYLVKLEWRGMGYLRAFAEAGMIGACADWFAVVALFRHPLGLPIPHTAIVRRNKERIGAAIGRFIANNFLAPRVIHSQIKEIDAAGWIARWLSNPANANRIARRAAAALPQILRALPRDELNAFLSRAARSGIEMVPAAPLASKLLSLIWAQGETQALVERAITLAATTLADKRGIIKSTVTKKSSRFLPKWVDAIVADKIVSGLTQLLEEMRDPTHPWRSELGVLIERLIDDLAVKPDLYARGEEFKAQILSNPVVRQQLRRLWNEIEARLEAASASNISQISDAIEHTLIAMGQRMTSDETIRTALNQCIRINALRVIAPRRAEIGAFVTRVVEEWDNDTLVNRIELQVGRDLQFIRINGTLVGGLVGLIIFAVTRWLPDPLF